MVTALTDRLKSRLVVPRQCGPVTGAAGCSWWFATTFVTAFFVHALTGAGTFRLLPAAFSPGAYAGCCEASAVRGPCTGAPAPLPMCNRGAA